jgi:hypothetical protein
MIRRLFLALVAAAGSPGVAQAQAGEGRVVAIVSLVADHLTVTGFESTTGSQLNVNPQERIELRDDGLERSMLRAAMKAVAEQKAGRALPLLTDDGRLYAAQDGIVSGDTARVPESLLQTLKAQKATHLLLATKHRAEARMQTDTRQLGSGRVEGLGFYVDRVAEITDVKTGHRSVGYIAPHVYVRLSLIDLRDGKVLASRTVTASEVIKPTDRDRGADPWTLLDSAAKVKAIDTLIARECAPALRALLAS